MYGTGVGAGVARAEPAGIASTASSAASPDTKAADRRRRADLETTTSIARYITAPTARSPQRTAALYGTRTRPWEIRQVGAIAFRARDANIARSRRHERIRVHPRRCPAVPTATRRQSWTRGENVADRGGWSWRGDCSSRAVGLGERRDLCDRAPHDQGVDLVGSLIGAYGFEVVGVAHRRVVERDSVPPKQRPSFAANRDCLAHVIELSEGDLLGAQRAGILLAACVHGHEQPLLYLQDHVHELLLRELEACDWPVELVAPEGISK